MKLGNAIARFRTADLKLRKMLAEFEDQRTTFVAELPDGENFLSRYSGEDAVALAINGNEKGEYGDAFNVTLHLERTVARLTQLADISKQHNLAEGYLQDVYDIKHVALDIRATLARERATIHQQQAEKAREEARLSEKARLAKVKEDRIREQVEKEVRARMAEEEEEKAGEDAENEEKAGEGEEGTSLRCRPPHHHWNIITPTSHTRPSLVGDGSGGGAGAGDGSPFYGTGLYTPGNNGTDENDNSEGENELDIRIARMSATLDRATISADSDSATDNPTTPMSDCESYIDDM